jgi:hypothetical protein
VVTLKAADRNIEVMRPYLEAAAASGRSQVAAIGVAQETQRVFISRKRDTAPGKCPQFSFDKKDRRVTVYYFYLWDAGFGPAFIKVCTYCPGPVSRSSWFARPSTQSSSISSSMPVYPGAFPRSCTSPLPGWANTGKARPLR